MKVIEIFLDVPVNARETNVNNSSGEDIVNAVLSKEEDDICKRSFYLIDSVDEFSLSLLISALLMHNLSTSNDQESSSVHPNETQVNAGEIFYHCTS